MYMENGLTATSWWWISTPRATGVIHTDRGMVDIAPPYFRFTIGQMIEKVILQLCSNKDTKVLQVKNYDDKEEGVRYS